MNNYTVMNLTMISRLAVLENAERTGEAIDSLVSILRYWESLGTSISTLEAEIKIVRKIFSLHQLKKGSSFSAIINFNPHQDKCYITKGLLVSLIETAIGKKTNQDKGFLEVIISVAKKEDHVVVIIKDNGEVERNEKDELLKGKYSKIKDLYQGENESLDISKKPNIGTKVKLIIKN